jgi:predicted porin
MKKSLLALAVLGAFAGAASAQSSVTLFGIVDVNVGQVKNETSSTSTKITRMSTDGINSSRLGFRGVEDLGGGMKAGFWLEAGLAPDTGGQGGSNGLSTVTFNRRSTVSLMGNFGEVRLGRDYDPSFWNLTVFDPFGTNGVGSFLNVISTFGNGASTLVRANNSVGYFLPSGIGGIYGQAMVAAGEGVFGQKYAGGRLGWAGGPVDVAVAYGQTQIAGDNKFKLFNIGGSWDFGVAKLMGQYVRADSDNLGNVANQAKADTFLIGVVVPMGQGEIHAAYDESKGKDAVDGAKGKQFALGYVYNLSKRSALYGTYSHISNSGGALFTVGQGGQGSAADGKSTGLEVGLRHSF